MNEPFDNGENALLRKLNIEQKRKYADRIMLYDRKREFLCKHDLRYLCRDILGMRDWDTVHDDIQEFLDKITWEPEERKKIGRQFRLVMIPRGHLKSSVVTKGWGIQQILRNPDIRILIANAVWDNARRFLGSMQEWMDSKSELPKIFGQFKPNQRNTAGWNKNEIVINQRTIVQDAKTVSTTGVEKTQTGQHYDIIILDDVVARENITTNEQREKIKNFYGDCLSLLEPDGVMMVVGTTWHEDDLYNDLRNDPDYKDGFFVRVAEQGTEESVIFKKKFTLQTLHNIKRKNVYLYSAQYLMNPYPDEEMEFKKRWIRFWKDLPQEPLYVSITIDPSLGKDTSDHSAIVAVGKTFERQAYVLEARHFKRSVDKFPEEVVATVRRLTEMGRAPHAIGLEAFAFQGAMFKKPIEQALKKERLFDYVEELPKRVTESKAERIRALIPKFADYSIWLHESHQDLVNEITRWNPDKSHAIDDILDALAWQLYYWDRKPGQVVKKINKDYTWEWWMTRAVKENADDNHILKEFR